MADGDQWQDWIGRKGVVVPGPYPVTLASIGYLAEALQDEQLAEQVASGDVTAPRSFVTIMSRVPHWRPKSATGPESFMQGMLVPIAATSGVNMGIDQKYHGPLDLGDTLVSQSTIEKITPKTTRLGEGFIIQELIEHRNQDGVLVATTENTLLRFQPATDEKLKDAPKPAAAPPAATTPPEPASDFPTIATPITMTVLAKAAGAVRDYAPLHHDIELARAAGHATAFLSYSHQIALIVQAVSQWYGGDRGMRRLKLSMKKPIYLGKTCVAAGVRQPSEDAGVDVIEVSLVTEDGLSSTGLVEIRTDGKDLWS